MKCPYCRCIRGKYILVWRAVCSVYFLYGYMYTHGCLLLSQQKWLYVKRLPTILSSMFLFCMVASTYPHKTNHVDIVTICEENIDCFLSERFGTCTLFSCTFTEVPTNTGKYNVSVKHTTARILFYCFSVLDSIVFFWCWYNNRPTLPCVFFFESNCAKFGVSSRPLDFTNPMPPT